MAAKKLVAVRFAASGLDLLDKIAEQEGITRSDIIRDLVVEALAARGLIPPPRTSRKAEK